MTKVTDSLPGKGEEFDEAAFKAKLIADHNQAEVKKSNFPTEIIDLPSRGLLYPAGHPLADGTIEMKYMTAKEEDILTTPSLIKSGRVFDKLFQAMIITPVNYDDLLIMDKNAIMIAARILGYGKEYNVSMDCPNCDHKNKLAFNLGDLDDTYINEDMISSPHINEFDFHLPHSNREIKFKLGTVGSDKAVEAELKGMKRAVKSGKEDRVDRQLTTRLKHMITSVDGNTDKAHIRNFVDEELFAMDSRELRKYMAKLQPESPMKFTFECSECDHTQDEANIPIDTGFFWPGA